MMIQGDNKAALAISKNPVNHKRSKHIHIAFGITRQAVMAKHIAPTYISTTENTADLMTKELTRKTHRHHTARLLVEKRGEKLFDVYGTRLELGGEERSQRKLYGTEPIGLSGPDAAREHLSKICDDGETSCKLTETEDRIKKAREAKPGPTTSDAKRALTRKVTSQVARGIAGRIARRVTRQVVQAVAAYVAMVVDKGSAAWERRAIVDSGASGIYVTRGVPLHNVEPGKGSVSVANGRVEAITETGSLGPLHGAHRVDSFTRTLVGVYNLTKQFDRVSFDNEGVDVETTLGDGRQLSTRIGRLTSDRLYTASM